MTTMTLRTSIWSRKLDLLYLIFFITHIPVMLLVDLSGYYPPSLKPAITTSIRNYYITNYRDRFFIAPPAWFHAYMALELVYHFPVSLWSIYALVNDHPLVPLNLLVFALETGVTTLTCAVEMLSWEGYTREEVWRLCGLYLPYLGLSVVMGLDMFWRLRTTLLAKHKMA